MRRSKQHNRVRQVRLVIPSGGANEVAQPGNRLLGLSISATSTNLRRAHCDPASEIRPPCCVASAQQLVRAAAVSKPVAAPAPAPVTAATSQTASVDAGILPDGTPEEHTSMRTG